MEQKTPEFQEKYKKRSAQEWKNAELKRFHGMTRAKGWGLKSITFQAKLTAIAVNLKRIAALVDDKWGNNPAPFTQFAVCHAVLKFIFNFKRLKTLRFA